MDGLIRKAPLFVCSVATEIGFRFEGVGTEYWAKLSEALGLPITMAQRAQIGDAFAVLAAKYKISRPSESAFSSHFSIISWPIANALLPIDLVGPIGRLMASAPVAALPGPGRTANFASLRAWASAAEGARLADWLRFEGPSERALASLLTENSTGIVPVASYERLRIAVATSVEAFFAVRTGRQRTRTAKTPAPAEQSAGRLTLARDAAGLKLFAAWNPLPPGLFDEARTAARSAAWRPRLWGAGAFLHSDTALGAGPFLLMHAVVPAADDPAYPDAAAVFGAGGDIAAALAARNIDWTATLLFDVDDDRRQGEQRFGPFPSDAKIAWVGTRVDGLAIERLRPLGTVCGYRMFEANLRDNDERAILAAAGLLSKDARSSIARHPTDAIAAPQTTVRPGRPFLLFKPGPPLSAEPLRALTAGERVAAISGPAGHPGARCEIALPSESAPIELSLFERDSAFEALIEQRLHIRVESPIALRDLGLSAELEIDGRLIVRSFARIAELPATINEGSPLLQALYSDSARSKLLEAGSGVLRFAIGRLVKTEVQLERPQGSVDWSGDMPELIGALLASELVSASTPSPHRFAPANAITLPECGATAYGLRLADGRIADPIKLLASSSFNLGDLAAHFANDLGSRLMRENGRGVGDIARARIAWSRALCTSLQAIAAKSRIVRQFEEPLVYDLCGRDWCSAEEADRSKLSDPQQALYLVALERGLAALPEQATYAHIQGFAAAFATHARELDPDWPLDSHIPVDGMMDEALNRGFTEAVKALQTVGQLLEVDPEDCDFGRPADEWESAAAEAIRRIRRSELAQLIAPSAGARQLRDRYYANVGIAEMAEDLAAWTRRFALPRGQFSPEIAASALQLWLSPAACDNADAAVRILANDPFVARATRYAAIRMGTTLGGSIS
ncbi:hypothetical protein [Acidiphilium multivorum]|uniref:hypothetical protein n=1 Tax=Acidiphilium multivorum TaxID=62140 RepID=UPI001B8D7D75|nr:hypothetical protein [Acidiphilium multivorum]